MGKRELVKVSCWIRKNFPKCGAFCLHLNCVAWDRKKVWSDRGSKNAKLCRLPQGRRENDYWQGEELTSFGKPRNTQSAPLLPGLSGPGQRGAVARFRSPGTPTHQPSAGRGAPSSRTVSEGAVSGLRAVGTTSPRDQQSAASHTPSCSLVKSGHSPVSLY